MEAQNPTAEQRAAKLVRVVAGYQDHCVVVRAARGGENFDSTPRGIPKEQAERHAAELRAVIAHEIREAEEAAYAYAYAKAIADVAGEK